MRSAAEMVVCVVDMSTFFRKRKDGWRTEGTPLCHTSNTLSCVIALHVCVCVCVCVCLCVCMCACVCVCVSCTVSPCAVSAQGEITINRLLCLCRRSVVVFAVLLWGCGHSSRQLRFS